MATRKTRTTLGRWGTGATISGAVAGLACILFATATMAAEKRVALVIGNAAYRHVSALANPRHDAQDIAAALSRLGFETTVALDADRAAMEQAVEEFAAKTETADTAVFYYAGHALQYQGLNYLVPTDANLQTAAGLRRLTRLNDIVADVRKAKALRILVLDACRDNPMVDVLAKPAAGSSQSRSVGLAKLARTADTNAVQQVRAEAARGGDIIVYAAESGSTASDGTGRNSPFTSALLRNIETEGQEVVSLMRRVAISVQNETGGAQRPELLLSVPFEFYFKPGAPEPPPTVAALLPAAKAHEIAEIELTVQAIVGAAHEADRAEVRQETMVLLADIVAKSQLKPDQIITELPKAHARLLKMRSEIVQFRTLMEAEPGIAPFVELAAAAVASGRRPDLAAADQALAQAQARYDEIIRARTEAVTRARSKRAALAEQRGHLAETGARLREAAEFYLAAARDTPETEKDIGGRRFAMAGSALLRHGTTFYANEDLHAAIRLFEREALARLTQVGAGDPETKKQLSALMAAVLAEMADAQTRLGSRLPGIDGARMMVEARATYGKALKSFDIGDYPGLAMDILDRRSQRDLEFGRRITKDRGRGHFAEAVKTMRLILKIQESKPAFAGEFPRTLNNLANALTEASRRTDGEAGDQQIAEAVELFERAAELLARRGDMQNALVARTNVARALSLRASRKPGPDGHADFERAKAIFAAVEADLDARNNPRLWALLKRFEAEMLHFIGERTQDRDVAFAALKVAFETYQKVLPITSRETAPNDWAMLCADMGHVLVTALPLLDESGRSRFADNAAKLFGAARPYFVAGGFGQDLQRLDQAMGAARQALGQDAEPRRP